MAFVYDIIEKRKSCDEKKIIHQQTYATQASNVWTDDYSNTTWLLTIHCNVLLLYTDKQIEYYKKSYTRWVFHHNYSKAQQRKLNT